MAFCTSKSLFSFTKIGNFMSVWVPELGGWKINSGKNFFVQNFKTAGPGSRAF